MGGFRARSLFALLVLNRNHSIATDALAERLWPVEAPLTATKTIQVYVSRLRRELGQHAGRLASSQAGYALRLLDAEVDIAQFESLLREARRAMESGARPDAMSSLEDARRLWRGPALGDLATEPFARHEAERLDELRMQALEDLVDLRLADGNVRDLIGEIRIAVRQHPSRERLWRTLMLALYADGRQAEALAAYHEARRYLDDELGIEPGASLREIERQVLNQDVTLPGAPRSSPSIESTAGLRQAPAAPNNLRAPLTNLIGRHDEVVALQATLARHRLVTITAPGGCGKTALANHLAWAALQEYAGGVWLVELADLRDVSLVPSFVRASVGATDDGSDPTTLLVAHLSSRKALLVLDNFEHLLEARGLVIDLLEGCPNLRVLVTSRIPLDVRGERLRPLAPLATDADGQPGPAVELFIERAADSGVDLPSDRATRDLVRSITSQLDGLPLAIELAATQLRATSLQGLVQTLAIKLTTLADPRHGVSDRQRTLRETIAWSCGLLTADERRCLAALSVFAGGTDMRGANAVIAGDERADTTLERLVVHNLLTRPAIGPGAGSGSERFAMLETIREFAALELAPASDMEMFRKRHADYFGNLASTSEDALLGVGQQEWLARLELEHDNIRLALKTCIATADERNAYRMVGSLWWFWVLRGHLREGQQWAERVLDAFPDAADGDRARAHFTSGTLAQFVPDVPATQANLNEALRLFESVDDTRGQGRTLNFLALLEIEHGRTSVGAEILGRAQAFAERADDASLRMWVSANACTVAWVNDDLTEAKRIALRTMAMANDLRDLQSEALAFSVIALIDLVSGNIDEAQIRARAGLEKFNAVGYPNGILVAHLVLASASVRTNRLADAGRYLRESLQVVGDVGLDVEALWLSVCASYATGRDQHAEGARLFGAADAIRRAAEEIERPSEQRWWEPDRTILRDRLGDGVFAVEAEIGGTWDRDTRRRAVESLLSV